MAHQEQAAASRLREALLAFRAAESLLLAAERRLKGQSAEDVEAFWSGPGLRIERHVRSTAAEVVAAFKAFSAAGLVASAEARGITLHEGVYAGLVGPSYETPAEIRMIRGYGADAVGMSTVLEAIALRHMGTRIAGISVISNDAAGIGAELNHAEVADVAAAAAAGIRLLVEELVARSKDWMPGGGR